MASNTPRTAKAKSAYWQKHINGWRHSGMSQSEYCQKNMLALSTFTLWKRKLSQPIKMSSAFYPLTVIQDQSERVGKESGLRLILGENRFTIEMAKDFSAETLSRLINTLEKLDAGVRRV